jgi:hypothetical protein
MSDASRGLRNDGRRKNKKQPKTHAAYLIPLPLTPAREFFRWRVIETAVPVALDNVRPHEFRITMTINIGQYLVALFLTPPLASAATIAYEGFNYQPAGSDLAGNNGGSGFSSPWTGGGFNVNSSTNYDVSATGLSYSNLQVSGGSVETLRTPSNLSGIYRDLATTFGTAGTTRYLSFLIQPTSFETADWMGIYLRNDVNDELFIGKGGGGVTNNWVLEARGGAGQVNSGVAVMANQTYLLVLRMNFIAGADNVSLFINPDLSLGEPGTPNAVKNDKNLFTISGLNIYSRGGFRLDEIRVGDTWADVTPTSAEVPEPSSLALMGAGGLLVAFGRKRFGKR